LGNDSVKKGKNKDLKRERGENCGGIRGPHTGKGDLVN